MVLPSQDHVKWRQFGLFQLSYHQHIFTTVITIIKHHYQYWRNINCFARNISHCCFLGELHKKCVMIILACLVFMLYVVCGEEKSTCLEMFVYYALIQISMLRKKESSNNFCILFLLFLKPNQKNNYILFGLMFGDRTNERIYRQKDTYRNLYYGIVCMWSEMTRLCFGMVCGCLVVWGRSSSH